MKKIVAILIALAAMVGIGFADDGADTATVEEDGTPGTPVLLASVEGNILTLQNTGTAPSVDIGGAVILVDGEGVGLLPYTTIISPDGKIRVLLSRSLVNGEKVRITNGVGVYAMGMAL